MVDPTSYRITEIAKEYARQWVKAGDVVMDATVGNGWDTLLLSELTGPSGKVYAFDIQPEALGSAADLLKTSDNVEFILDSHVRLKEYVKGPLDFAMFNLGFMPGGDKSITTEADTTLQALKNTLEVLKNNKAMTICIYPGHPEGMREKDALEHYFSGLSSKSAFVLKTMTLNAANSPYCLLVIKRAGYSSESR